jgi:hypothetical protein
MVGSEELENLPSAGDRVGGSFSGLGRFEGTRLLLSVAGALAVSGTEAPAAGPVDVGLVKSVWLGLPMGPEVGSKSGKSVFGWPAVSLSENGSAVRLSSAGNSANSISVKGVAVGIGKPELFEALST